MYIRPVASTGFFIFRYMAVGQNNAVGMPLRAGRPRRGHWQHIMTKIERVRLAGYVVRNGKCYMLKHFGRNIRTKGDIWGTCVQ